MLISLTHEASLLGHQLTEAALGVMERRKSLIALPLNPQPPGCYNLPLLHPINSTSAHLPTPSLSYLS